MKKLTGKHRRRGGEGRQEAGQAQAGGSWLEGEGGRQPRCVNLIPNRASDYIIRQ
jgi:hypothetical protein